jgi:hypothetical protein
MPWQPVQERQTENRGLTGKPPQPEQSRMRDMIIDRELFPEAHQKF